MVQCAVAISAKRCGAMAPAIHSSSFHRICPAWLRWAAGQIGSDGNIISSWSGAAWSCGMRAKPPFLLAGEGVPKQNAKSGWVPYIVPPGVEGYGSRRRRATPRPGRRPTYKSHRPTQFSYKVYTISYYAPGLRWFRGEGQQTKLRKSPG